MVSVVIPAHNSEPYLRETIESVLAQKHRPLELIVVDDGSTDGTAAIARGYGSDVKVVPGPRLGHPAARNAGIREARGELLAFLDHDDIWSVDKLELQLDCLRTSPEIDLVFGHIQNFFSPELSVEERARLAVPLDPLPGLLQGAMLARRASFDRVGMFLEKRGMGDFLDWFGRATVGGLRYAMLAETVLHRRIHRSNYQRLHRADLRAGYLQAVKELLDRRRAAGTRNPD